MHIINQNCNLAEICRANYNAICRYQLSICLSVCLSIYTVYESLKIVSVTLSPEAFVTALILYFYKSEINRINLWHSLDIIVSEPFLPRLLPDLPSPSQKSTV